MQSFNPTGKLINCHKMNQHLMFQQLKFKVTDDNLNAKSIALNYGTLVVKLMYRLIFCHDITIFKMATAW